MKTGDKGLGDMGVGAGQEEPITTVGAGLECSFRTLTVPLDTPLQDPPLPDPPLLVFMLVGMLSIGLLAGACGAACLLALLGGG